ncbi:fucose 4-O-acetylase-like acetyltransferase [Kineothrix alysoides]|uniref:Fucose 4-O-acetylase-like acetyltransferase n=1 Tax=Kineothrix alysoides TaxID=1469948 RepID=A0A4R1R4G7_9FIRM|nr:acyltransferase family protein [Kineothrix alysoides]TCL60318.1 fucose 4-O-acetylase-like acetyltransferase [Kineothrix alysoides]
MEKKRENDAFRIFSAIGIILIVAGHADFHIFDLGGLFPYYSFHVAVFLFISGYFYDENDEVHIGAYIRRKALRLLVPYFLWNLFYGGLAAVLKHFGFIIGDGITFKTLFLDPFLTGHQFGYNFPAWFVPSLFLVEVINVCMRRVLTAIRLNKEYLIMAAVLLAGILTVWFAIGGHVWGYYKFPGRILFMLPAFELGQLYKKKLERKDTLSNGIYFSILLVIQLIVVFSCAGLAYSTVWCASFANGPVIPFVTMATGIAFWLRVSKMLSPLLPGMKGTRQIGTNTYGIMMHHVPAFFLVKGTFFALSVFTPWCADFDKPAFLTDVNYIYLLNGMDVSKWIYIAAGVVIPLAIGKMSKAGYGALTEGLGRLRRQA